MSNDGLGLATRFGTGMQAFEAVDVLLTECKLGSANAMNMHDSVIIVSCTGTSRCGVAIECLRPLASIKAIHGIMEDQTDK
jgi:hypothetical protein